MKRAKELLCFGNVTSGITFYLKVIFNSFMDILPYMYLKLALIQSYDVCPIVNNTSA